MKVRIEFEYKPEFLTKYWAKTGVVNRGGHSWEEAEKNLMEVLKTCCKIRQIEEQDKLGDAISIPITPLDKWVDL